MKCRIIAMGLLCAMLAAGHAAAQSPYKWVDKDGKVHYGDIRAGAGVCASLSGFKCLFVWQLAPAGCGIARPGGLQAVSALVAHWITRFAFLLRFSR